MVPGCTVAAVREAAGPREAPPGLHRQSSHHSSHNAAAHYHNSKANAANALLWNTLKQDPNFKRLDVNAQSRRSMLTECFKWAELLNTRSLSSAWKKANEEKLESLNLTYRQRRLLGKGDRWGSFSECVLVCVCVLCVHVLLSEATFENLFEFVTPRPSEREGDKTRGRDQTALQSFWPFTSHTSHTSTFRFFFCLSHSLPLFWSFST